jgi:serine/threonine protein phosphatase PrpC
MRDKQYRLLSSTGQPSDGRILACSVAGASHQDKKTPCQDSAFAVKQYFKGHPYCILGVADGHGGDKYLRSETGSFLAILAVHECVSKYILSLVAAMESNPAHWYEEARDDFTNRFGKSLTDSWRSHVKRHYASHPMEGVAEESERSYELYGSTVSLCLVFNEYLFAGRIGDSSTYILQDLPGGPAVEEPFEDVSEQPGLGTASLCSKEAYRKWQSHARSLSGVKLVMLATDGFADSLARPQDEVKDIYGSTQKISDITDELIVKFNRLSDRGVGDDVSAALYIPDR